MERIERPTADWWKRLQRAKPLELDETWLIDYVRTYQKNLDIERLKRGTINKLARFTAAKNNFELVGNNLDIKTDFVNFLSTLNDNDIENYYRQCHRPLDYDKRLLDIEFDIFYRNVIGQFVRIRFEAADETKRAEVLQDLQSFFDSIDNFDDKSKYRKLRTETLKELENRYNENNLSQKKN
jgi:hypothetical protein